jgi:hypothetical protein
MAIIFLHGTEPWEYREYIEISLVIASISSPDLRKQTAIIRQTLHPDGKPTSSGMIARVLGMAKPTTTEHSTRDLTERRYSVGPTGRRHRLTKTIEEAITVKAIESSENKVACTYSDLVEFVFEWFGATVSNQLARLTAKRNKRVTVLTAHPMEDARVKYTPSEIDAHFALVAQELQRLPASLLYKLKEMGWPE